MLNPSLNIIKGFISALSGISYGGNTIPVYMIPPQNPDDLYIQIGTVTTVEAGCKDLFGHECTIDIQVIDLGKRNYQSPKRAEEVSSLVLQALKPDVISTVSLDEFDMIYLILDNSFNDAGLFESDRSYRRILQYRFLANEKVISGDWILATGFWDDFGVWIDTETWND